MIGRTDPPSGTAEPLAPELSAAIELVQAKVGRTALTSEDLLMLAAGAITRTYTFEEKNYHSPSGRVAQER